MTDYSELKRLAECAAKGDWSGAKSSEFMAAANPAAVLALIHDLDVATSVGRALGITLSNVAEARDGLVTVVASQKAEIEALTAKHAECAEFIDSACMDGEDFEALRLDAERYRWLRDSSEAIHPFYLSTPIWFTGVKFNKENVDSTIDAAMNKDAAHD
jgi:hypothetical protein